MRPFLILNILSMFAVIPAHSQSAAAVRNGKPLFDTKYRCYTCHGYEGHGGMGPRLVAMMLPSAAFIAYVRSPRRMPAFSPKTIPDTDLYAIWSYLKSLRESPAVSEIPLLRDLLAP